MTKNDIIQIKERKNSDEDVFVLHEEIIDYFHNNFYIHRIEKLSLHISHVIILGSMECKKN